MILPGLMCDSRMFSAQLSAFSDILVVDGFYAGCHHISDMADYALARAPEKFALLGHSMGARIALEVIRKAPERVERIAFADTGIHPVRAGEAEKRHALRDVGRQHGMAALVNEWLPPMMAPAQQENAALVAMLHDMAVDAGLATFEAQIDALLSRPAVEDLLPTINCPAFAIVGDEDIWSPVDQHQSIVDQIPGAQLRVVKGAGHMLPAEKPQEFNEILREWLKWPSHVVTSPETFA